MKTQIVLRTSTFLSVLTTLLISGFPESSYAYRTKEDCESSEGVGECCMTPDGTYHRKAACECYTDAVKGDADAQNKWISILNTEYLFYKERARQATRTARSSRGTHDERVTAENARKATDDLAWAKKQLISAKGNRSR